MVHIYEVLMNGLTNNTHIRMDPNTPHNAGFHVQAMFGVVVPTQGGETYYRKYLGYSSHKSTTPPWTLDETNNMAAGNASLEQFAPVSQDVSLWCRFEPSYIILAFWTFTKCTCMQASLVAGI